MLARQALLRDEERVAHVPLLFPGHGGDELLAHHHLHPTESAGALAAALAGDGHLGAGRSLEDRGPRLDLDGHAGWEEGNRRHLPRP